jgi:hypothetical protein
MSLSKIGFVLLFLSGCLRLAGAAERPPQTPLPPQAPAVQTSPAGAKAAKACSCCEGGDCECGSACVCGLVAALAPTDGYAVAYERAVATGRPLVVWVGMPINYHYLSVERRLPSCIHCYVDKFPDAEPRSAVVASVEADGTMIRVDDLPNPTAAAIENALACHRQRRDSARQQFFGRLRGGCAGGG